MNNLEKLAIELKKNNIDYYTRLKTQLIINAGYVIRIGLQNNLFHVFITAEGLEPIILEDITEIMFGYAHRRYPQLVFWNATSMVARLRLK